jgi:phenylalanyl-tRNA synthetase alpha chain
MSVDIESIREEALGKINRAEDEKTVGDLKVEYIGRKGVITTVLRSISELPQEQRKVAGEKTNALKEELSSLFESKLETLRKAKISEEIQKQSFDTTLPPFPFETGHVHPLEQTLKDISEIFESIGYNKVEGPEIETEWYNFEALNIPKDHPARDSQDTFYLVDGKRLLRTHTSPCQVHVMEKQKPPLRIIAPGRVFRNEATDATHSAMFHQVEGLAIDENITFGDLKGTLTYFVKRYFGEGCSTRFRPSHFQFTEPSAEIDVQCTMCGGKGCRICKNTGWLEMGGCGMVHPNVLKSVNFDPEKYQGFAFGLGVERFAMFKYGVDDIRLFYENNIMFLKQF